MCFVEPESVTVILLDIYISYPTFFFIWRRGCLNFRAILVYSLWKILILLEKKKVKLCY